MAPKKFICVVLLATVCLQLCGAAALYGFDGPNTHIFSHSVTAPTKLIDTYYLSVSARTAGFTVFPNLAQLSSRSNYILMVLMFIGASSGSFAGGVLKLTVLLYITVYLASRLRGDGAIGTRRRYLHFSQRTVLEANFRLVGFGILLFVLSFALLCVERAIPLSWLAFESISAISNTGLSLGATGLFGSGGLLVVIIMMSVGKLGFIATVTSFFPRYQGLVESAATDLDEFPVD